MASQKETTTSLPSDCSVKIRRGLGYGRCGTVYDARVGDTDCALKVFNRKDDFVRELRAYQKVSESDALRAWVPAFRLIFKRVHETLPGKQQCYGRAICIDLIPGRSLDKVIDSLPVDESRRLHDSLRDALRALHQAGVSHGDIREENIMLAKDGGKLIDFSHATFRTRVSPTTWEIDTEDDFEMLDSIFAAADTRRAAQNGLEFLSRMSADDAAQQDELARLLDSSYPCRALVEAVQNGIESPLPRLALSIARALQRDGQTNSAVQFIKTYLTSAVSASQGRKSLSLLHLRILLARYGGDLRLPDSFEVYEETIADFKELLGKSHLGTMRILIDYARFLMGRGRWDVAMNVCLDALGDLSDALQENTQNSNVGGAGSPAQYCAWGKLVGTVRTLVRHEEDESVRSRAEGFLRRVIPAEHKSDGSDQSRKRKRDVADNDPTEGRGPSKCLKEGNMRVDETNAGSDKENNM